MADADLDEHDHAPRPGRRVGPAGPEPRQLRLHRTVLLCAAGAYLGWWGFVHVALPDAFNPLASRAAVVACFLAVLAASYASQAVATHVDGWLAACCGLATVHYFYLFDRNHADLNWVVGSYVTVMAVCAILQTSRSLVFYSLLVTLLSAAILERQPGLPVVVFLPGMLTILLFANVGLRHRLRLVAQLRESHDRISSLFDSGFEGIAVHEHGVIREVNGALCGLAGYRRDELLGKDLAELFDADADAGETPRETQLTRRDRTRVAVEVVAKAHVLNAKTMVLVAVRDLTARKVVESALRLANQELETFSYSVAHDLRTPLRGIDGFACVLLEDAGPELDAGAREHLDRIRAGARRMGEIIDALLVLSRVSRTTVRREPVDLGSVARSVAAELQAVEPARSVTFTAEGDVPPAHADTALVRVLMVNLLGNAWKFTHGRERAANVAFGVERGGEQAVYFVRDDGAGFDAAYKDKLFLPFQRLHPTTEFPGTGIGLATVARIVRLHGGRIWAEGAVDRGATFRFTLPSAPGAVEPPPRDGSR